MKNIHLAVVQVLEVDTCELYFGALEKGLYAVGNRLWDMRHVSNPAGEPAI